MKPFLTEQQVSYLRTLHRSQKLRRHADRIKTILFLNQGFTFTKTAHLLMLHEDTVSMYYEEYCQEGLEKLLADDYQRKTSLITKESEQKLTAYLEKHTYQTVGEISAYIKKVYRVKYIVSGATRLLHRMGFVYKKEKPVPGKADRNKQKAFLQIYQTLKKTKKTSDQIYFADATHPTYQSLPAYGWIKKGTIKELKTTGSRRRLNLHGAVNAATKDTLILPEEIINASAAIRLGEALLKTHSTATLYVIFDTKQYHAKEVARRFHRSRLKLVFLPPYSPNLNLIERLWLFFHKQILYNRYYPTFEEFTTACMGFFSHLNRYQPALNTLLRDDFHLLGA